jgi:hypothetical protein
MASVPASVLTIDTFPGFEAIPLRLEAAGFQLMPKLPFAIWNPPPSWPEC